MNSQEKGEKLRNGIAFFVFGFCVYTMVSVKIVIAEDVLADSTLPTTVVFICGMGPWFLTTLILPHFIHKVSYFVRVFCITIFGSGGLLMISLSTTIALKLSGVCLTSLSCGISAVTFIPLTAFYREETIKAYTAGTGFGICLGTFYYAALTCWACVSPEATLLSELLAPVLLLVIYIVLLEKKELRRQTSQPLTTPLLSASGEESPTLLSSAEKLKTIGKMLRYVFPFYLGVFCQWIVSQSIATTMAFPNGLFQPRDLYQFYIFAFVLGNFICRSYRLFLSLLKSGSTFIIRPTWLLTLCLIAIAIFMAVASWYRYPKSAWMVGGLLFVQGMLAGLLYTSTLSVVGEKSNEPGVKEFSRAFITVASVSGAVTAGFLGLYIEQLFVNHCVSVEEHNRDCYTRFVGKWNTTTACYW